MSSISRRKMLQKHDRRYGTRLHVSHRLLPWPGARKTCACARHPIQRKGNIRQSVSRWCYPKMTLDELCAYSAQIGLKGVDLLEPEDYEVAKEVWPDLHHGLRRAAAPFPMHSTSLPITTRSRPGYVSTYRWLQKPEYPMSLLSPEIAAACPMKRAQRMSSSGLNRMKKIAEDNNVVLCLELLEQQSEP